MAPWLLEFAQSLGTAAAARTPGITLHLPVPDRRTVTPELRQLYHRVGRLLVDQGVAVWSGGWSGAPAALLTRDELVWEARWSVTNEDNTGLHQLLACTPSAFYPSGATPAQAEHLASTLDCAVVGGYTDSTHFHLFSAGSWYVASSVVLDPLRTDGSTNHDAADQAVPIVHLVIDRDIIATFPHAQDLVNTIEPELSMRLSGPASLAAKPTAKPFLPIARGKQPANSYCFAPRTSGPGATPAADPIKPGTAAMIRRTTRMNHQRISRVLQELSPYTSRDRMRFDKPPGMPGRASPQEFQGSTEGHLTIEENGMTLRFAGGRLAGIALDLPRGTVQTVPRRALGYARLSATNAGGASTGRPQTSFLETRYLETRQAAWYAGTQVRMVEEQAILPIGDAAQEQQQPIRLITRGAVNERVPGLLLSYRVQVPPAIPAGSVEISLFAIPLMRQTPDDACTIGVVDGEGEYTSITLPSGPGRWVIPAWLLRIPLSTDDQASTGDLWLGSAEPGQRLVIPWTITRSPTDRGLLLAVDGIHAYTYTSGEMPAGLEQTGTLILADGRRKATELLLGTGDTVGVTPFASGFVST